MENFTPVQSLIGGALIGLSAAILWASTGRVAGISGIAGRLVQPLEPGERAWRVAFVAGLVLVGVVAAQLAPGHVVASDRAWWLLGLAGLFVGVGTRIGNGCTSGHGVCGLGRLSGRSLAAVITFMLVAGITVLVSRLLGGDRKSDV